MCKVIKNDQEGRIANYEQPTGRKQNWKSLNFFFYKFLHHFDFLIISINLEFYYFYSYKRVKKQNEKEP